MILARRQEMTASVTGQAQIDFVRDALAGGKPLNWVVTGERYKLNGPSDSIVETISRDLRNVHDRSDDNLFDSTQRGDRVIALEMSVEHRVLRYDTHVAVICVGADDPRIEQRIAECQAFGRLLDELKKHHIAAVVIPPPTFVGPPNDPRLNRWRDDIVEMTHSRDAVLVPTNSCGNMAAVSERLRDVLSLRYPVSFSDDAQSVAVASRPAREILPLVR